MAAKYYKNESGSILNFIKVDGEFVYNFSAVESIIIFEKNKTSNFFFDENIFKEVSRSDIQNALNLLNSEVSGL
jgi:hypothetical protein